VSASFPRNSRPATAALLLLSAAFLLAGCPAGGKLAVLPPGEEELLRAKGDERLLVAVRDGGKEPFAAVAVFRGDVFLRHSAKLEQASIPPLNMLGNTAILLLQPGQVVPLLKDPDVRRIAWFGPRGRLARLDPSLELDAMARYGDGTDGKDRTILLRCRDVPGVAEEGSVTAAGYRIVTRAGPNLVVSGPYNRLPELLGNDRIIYLEKASNQATGNKVEKDVPHSTESVSDMKEREAKEPLPPRGDVAIPSHRIPRGDNTVAPAPPAGADRK